MPDPIPPERIADIRSLFFGRLAEINRDLVQSLAFLTVSINDRNYNVGLAEILDAENRLQAMRSILIVLRECLES